MNILAIETSCDETAISIISATARKKRQQIVILSNIVLSQAALHARYGGVFPSLAKREHSKNLVPILITALTEANLLSPLPSQKSDDTSSDFRKQKKIKKILEKEPELLEKFLKNIPVIQKPKIDAIAVTYGPGLEPALWVGINFAKAIALEWNLPIIPINHMEGHIFSSLLKKENSIKYSIENIKFPILALLVSGGHTELILIKDWFMYKIIGQTIDDAVGEAFDKVGRMLGLPYPGGPEVSALAKTAKSGNIVLPRPMIKSDDFNFSFSGLKTAVFYLLKNLEKKNIVLDKKLKAKICEGFQNAAVDVLVSKTIRAAKKYKIQTILLGGGVSANKHLQKTLGETIKKEIPNSKFLIPNSLLTGDNALMIAVALFFRYLKNKSETPPDIIHAKGNLRLS